MPQEPVRLLLINPCPPESFWSFSWAMDRVMVPQRTLNPPLGLATLAALCPAHWEVTIVDEAVEPIPAQPDADIIGVCGMGVQHARQRELLGRYREQGYYTVAGGSFASLCPEQLTDLADTVVAGEAEAIWPRFCTDFEEGRPQASYVESGAVEMEDVPVPRFDLLSLDRYATASLQFSRGCPYQCDFCDIIVMFGRRPRTKAPEQIGRELDALRAQGANSTFFVDDNLIGNKKVAKELLRYLADYQKRHGYPFLFGTEASLNLAQDPEMLGLFREAGFGWVFLGIETPDVESLRAAGKMQNTKADLLDSVHTLYAYGIDVFGGFIVGFDNDTPEAFENQHRFIMDAGIQVAMVGLLTALPRTPLYERLEQEGRLRHDVAPGDNTGGHTNIIPAGMSYQAMVNGYTALYRRLFSDQGIARRIRNKVRYLKQPAAGGSQSPARQRVLLRRVLWRGILPGGPGRWLRFGMTLACPPRLWPQVVSDWVRGLSMRNYVDRHFKEAPARVWRRAARVRVYLNRRFAAAVERGALSADLETTGLGPSMRVRLRGAMDTAFFTSGRRRLERLLRQPGAHLTLRIETVYQYQREALIRFLDSLAAHRDRISVSIADQAREQLGTEVARLGLSQKSEGFAA